MPFMQRLSLAAAAGFLAPSALACSSCGCTLSSDWLVQGGQYSGFHADFRFDYFNQDGLRSGTHGVNRGSIELPAEQDVQQETVNRNYNLFRGSIATTRRSPGATRRCPPRTPGVWATCGCSRAIAASPTTGAWACNSA